MSRQERIRPDQEQNQEELGFASTHVRHTMIGNGGDGAAGGPDAAPAADAVDATRPAEPAEPDRYVFAGEHARGGLGRVLRAHDRTLERTVAVKELMERSALAEALFVREALITARLQHPGVVPVHDAGRRASGAPYFVMKLVDGRSLRALIAERRSVSERLELLPSVVTVVETIAYAHSEGVIHRDIKPGNVLVGEFGETVVIDWGLAADRRRGKDGREPDAAEVAAEAAVQAAVQAALGSGQGSDGPGSYSDSAPELTVAGKVIGTPPYMAPEQARGDVVDERSDVYALGALLYEVISGGPPYTGTSARAIVSKVLAGPPAPLDERKPDAPPDLVTIVHKAMARNPAERYGSARELADELRRFQTGRLVVAHHYSTRERIVRWLARYRSAVAVAAVAMVLLAALGVFSIRRIIAERNEARLGRSQAQAAQRAAEDRERELLDLQAASVLERDPTATLAWLKQATQEGEAFHTARALYDKAVALGVARHVLLLGRELAHMAFSADGRSLITITGNALDRVQRWDLATGAAATIGLDLGDISVWRASADGRWLFVSKPGNTVVAVELETGQSRVVLEQAGEILRIGTFGQRLWIRAKDRTDAHGRNRVFAWEPGQERAQPVWEPESFTQAPFLRSEDDWLAAYRTDDGSVVIYDVATRTALRTISAGSAGSSGPAGPEATWMTFLPGRRFLARTDAGVMQVMDIASGRVLVEHRSSVGIDQVWGSSSGRLVAFTNWRDHDIHVLNVETGTLSVLRGHDDRLYQVRFTRDDARVISASDDSTVRVWELATGRHQVLRGHADDVISLLSSPDETLLATRSVDGMVRIWELTRDRVMMAQGRRARAVTAGPDGTVLSYGYGMDVRRWDLDSGAMQVMATLSGPPLSYNLLTDQEPPAVSPDGRWLAAYGYPEGTLALWSMVTGERYELPPAPEPASERVEGQEMRQEARQEMRQNAGQELRQEARQNAGQELRQAPGGWAWMPGRIPAVLAFSPDSRALVFVGKQGQLVWWDVQARSGHELMRDAQITSVAFSPDGARLAVATPGRIELWDPATRTRARELTWTDNGQPAPELYRMLLFAPDGRWLAASTRDRRAVVWNLGAGGAASVVASNTRIMAFAPDSRELALTLDNRTVLVHPLAGGQPRILRGHTDLVWSLAYVDSQRLASGSHDHTVRLWNTATGRARVLYGHEYGVYHLAYLPERRLLVSSSLDGTLRLWPITDDAIPDSATLRTEIESRTSAVVLPGGRIGTPPALRAQPTPRP